MIRAKAAEIWKGEAVEIIRGNYSSPSRDCRVSGRMQNVARASLEINEGLSKIAINCTGSYKAARSAINCTKQKAPIAWPTSVRDFLHHSLSASTKRAYEADLAHYVASGRVIPSSPQVIAEYLAEIAGSLAVATIQRRLAALSKAHRASGVDDPTKAEIVKGTLRGIRRMHGTPQREARPVLREDLFAILDCMGDRLKDKRDKALLLLGFAGAFRRSELVGLNIADIEHVRQGIITSLHRSKTDQEGRGRKVGIPHGRTRWCPIMHLTDWLDHAGVNEGPIFRRINRHAQISNQRLSAEAVSIIVKERAEAAGFDPETYSGHSLRAGLATSAASVGTPTWKIRQQTGHASDAMLSRYIRDGDMFNGNAAGAVL